ncbi:MULTISPECIES: hypothetical protein [Elizabethkingia]|uniref:hypothetical protein n=1 Tax=Elizabethkingia TaxID=308865 RepID=UPI0010C232DE|nr:MULTISPECIES: hypothetical protein [Elizabethkingia]QCO45764.1 hypothetical protein FCS00_05040 [Elizabethkingia sp. 2-6]WQM37683.1 hypothetical protein U2S95_15090 [Elizabethkingia miricola]
MGSVSTAEQVSEMDMNDEIVILIDGCQRRITKIDLLKDVVFGDIDLGEVIENSFEGIGSFTPENIVTE